MRFDAQTVLENGDGASIFTAGGPVPRRVRARTVATRARAGAGEAGAEVWLTKRWLTKRRNLATLWVMTTISVYEAKTQLSRLLRRVEAGEEVVIARDGHPVARLVGVARATVRKYGAGEGKIWIADDFDAPDDEADEQPIEPIEPAVRGRRRKR